MTWQKLGLVYCPDGSEVWRHSHASHPVAESIEGSIVKIYFNTRDRDNQAHVSTLLLDLTKPNRPLELCPEPILSPGNPGFFDDSGVQVCSIEKTIEGDTYLYYLGWNLGVKTPFRNSIGLAVRKKNASSFEKFSSVPILDRSEIDPITLSYPWVIREGGVWHMWYGSHTSWQTENFPMKHVIRYASSHDGIAWARSSDEVISPILTDGEYAVSRPSIVKIGDCYKMWFSCRHNSYRMGFASTKNIKKWDRTSGEEILHISQDGWDSQSVEYASAFINNDQLYMLYNGNDYGRSGFGIAKWQERRTTK